MIHTISKLAYYKITDPPTGPPPTYRQPKPTHRQLLLRPTDHQLTDMPSTDPPTTDHRLTDRSSTNTLITDLPTHRPPTHPPSYNWPPALWLSKLILTGVTTGLVLSITNFNSSFEMGTIYYWIHKIIYKMIGKKERR